MASGSSVHASSGDDHQGHAHAHAMNKAPVVSGTTCVLFASSAERPAPYSLLRALSVADRRGIRLLVLRVLPRRSLFAALLAPFLQNDDMRQMTSFLGAARASSRWVATILGERFHEEQLLVSIGGFEVEVDVQARAVNASMIVIPAGEWPGAAITALASRARLPVLVVRELERTSGHAKGVWTEAGRRESDTVVVGTLTRDGMTDAVRANLAAETINLARGCVLVVPIDLPARY